MNYQAELSFVRNTNFHKRPQVFVNYEEALAYAEHCADANTLIADYRVVEVSEPANVMFTDSGLVKLTMAELPK